ncbi:AGCS family alanine or glycine:cation symporter [Caldalkalibacillus uzonensis]|uniref:AGCS family alanine or glycine:cation symporter n=1 Tax=Caldalkalibacillus uzonensis TaxID=353224 RepID=A0ABU0CRL5_9BACI|nr:alanine/glycine:cation symporter family protein [Caldalkalibacillus uzonensis]MDQ0338718.1 AGCS family alanine or glycine:cation symporter [Caldalkalibacillus uzonensis]
MSILESIIAWGNDLLWSYVLIVMLIGLGVYFSLKTRFVQFKLVGEMFRLLKEGMTPDSTQNKAVSSFQAFTISTASRVGTGNMAGVALAISLGGPGAVFWMWIIALIGAASGFVESTLAQIYKVKDGSGFRGGPAYYMEKGLNKRWMGIIFAVLITITFGLVFNSVQANTISLALEEAWGIDRGVMGLILAVLLGIIIFGGVNRIARVTAVIVPVMAMFYIGVALFVVLKNFTMIPEVVILIVGNAFGLQEVVGGGLGAALMNGIKRGLFSNEAGMGSAPNAAATASVSHPVKQGLIQSLSVFTDTLIICSATAFIILMSGIYLDQEMTGIALTQAALSTQVGDWASGFVAIAILLFAFSSLVGNYYYGETNIEFIRSSKTWLTVYRLAVIAMVAFGSVAQLSLVWDMADLFMGLMAIINLIAIALLGKFAFAALQDYLEQRREGKDPVFNASRIEGLAQAECWDDVRQHGQK